MDTHQDFVRIKSSDTASSSVIQTFRLFELIWGGNKITLLTFPTSQGNSAHWKPLLNCRHRAEEEYISLCTKVYVLQAACDFT